MSNTPAPNVRLGGVDETMDLVDLAIGTAVNAHVNGYGTEQDVAIATAKVRDALTTLTRERDEANDCAREYEAERNEAGRELSALRAHFTQQAATIAGGEDAPGVGLGDER